MRKLHLRLIATCLILTGTSAASAQDAGQGRKVFQTCAACHSGGSGAFGPNLHGVVGRRAGAQAGFHYSAAMQRSRITWTPGMLRRFLTNPQGTVPGNRMPLAPLTPADAEAVTKYLTTMK